MPSCRNCSHKLQTVFADLGLSPLANEYLPVDEGAAMQRFFALKVYVCDHCLLVQLDEIESHEAIFSDYAYLSSASSSWLKHARGYASDMRSRLDLGPHTRVVELASNDGYLLQFFLEDKIPVLGVEPAANVAQIAKEKGIPTRVDFFGRAVAEEIRSRGPARLVIANNVLAHVPDIHDFVAGVRILMDDDSVFTAEFPHLLNLIARLEFDTIYHEHFSYFSLAVVQDILSGHDLVIVDVDELPTHGGSLRIHAQTQGSRRQIEGSVAALLQKESEYGLDQPDVYRSFDETLRKTKRELLTKIISYKEAGRRIVGYGAPAKAATFFNYCGIDHDLVDFTVDTNPMKQGRFIPGTRIPIHAPPALLESKPDLIWILPWNISEEIINSIGAVREHGAKFLLWDRGLKEVS